MVHPNELDQQIENLRTLQQSYDQIATAAEAYNVGKTKLAQAITSKGVETSPTESYPEMAEKVNAIAQETYEINGGEMYAKQLFGSLETPNYWNLYDVLAQLLSDGRFINYGGILLAEYYKGYDSLALEGAGTGGAYLTSDGDYYQIDTTHIWHDANDGKNNRWVAFLFAQEGHGFVINNTDISPRSIFIGRKVGTITLNAAGRATQVVVPDGNELQDIQTGTYSQNFNRVTILRNIQNHSSGYLITPSAIQNLYIHCKNVSGGALIHSGSSVGTLNNIIFNIENATGGVLLNAPSGVNFSNIFSISIFAKGYIKFQSDNSNSTVGLRVLNLVDVESLTLYDSANYVFGTTEFKINISYKTNDKTKSVALAYQSLENYNGWYKISDVELKDGWCKPLNISGCFSLTEANMYAHILQRLKQDEPDCGDGVTITLGSTNLAKLTSEESVQLLDDLTNIYGYTFA